MYFLELFTSLPYPTKKVLNNIYAGGGDGDWIVIDLSNFYVKHIIIILKAPPVDRM